jgi:hypothetical protein
MTTLGTRDLSISEERDPIWVKEEYKKLLRWRRLILRLSFASIVVICIGAMVLPASFSGWFTAAVFLFVLANVLYADRKWRCPACAQPLERIRYHREPPEYCERCGTALKG